VQHRVRVVEAERDQVRLRPRAGALRAPMPSLRRADRTRAPSPLSRLPSLLPRETRRPLHAAPTPTPTPPARSRRGAAPAAAAGARLLQGGRAPIPFHTRGARARGGPRDVPARRPRGRAASCGAAWRVATAPAIPTVSALVLLLL